MKYPLSHYYCFSLVPDDMLGCVINEFKDNGVTNFVLPDVVLERIVREPSRYGFITSLAKKHGITFGDAHMPFGQHFDICCMERARRKKMIEEQKQAMAYAADLGCRTCTIHVGAFDSIIFQTPNSTLRPFGDATLDELVPEAEKLGITLALENSFERCNTPDEVLRYLSRFNSKNFGICFDSGHANLMEYFEGKDYNKYFGGVTKAWRDSMEYCNDALDKLLPHIVTCHLHDNDGYGDDHAMPFDGIIDWKKLADKLLTAPRLQTIQSEVAMGRFDYSVKKLVDTFNKIF